jgi:hypothetical protein
LLGVIGVDSTDERFFVYHSHTMKLSSSILDESSPKLGNRTKYAYDAYGDAVGFDPTTAGTTHLFTAEQFDAVSGW